MTNQNRHYGNYMVIKVNLSGKRLKTGDKIECWQLLVHVHQTNRSNRFTLCQITQCKYCKVYLSRYKSKFRKWVHNTIDEREREGIMEKTM